VALATPTLAQLPTPEPTATLLQRAPTRSPVPILVPLRPDNRPTLVIPSAGADVSKPVATAVRPIAPGTGIAPRPTLKAGSRIAWQGEDWYLLGANVPWLNWGRDFGGGAKDGLSNPENRKTVSDGFGNAKANGVNVIRWWAFEGDAWQIKRDDSGLPTGLDEAIYADFDAALELAQQHDLYYVFVLFSAPQHIPVSWMEDGAQRAALGSVLGALFARYKDNPRVMTWEVFNEPEFDVWDHRIREEPMKALIQEIAASVHANCNAYVTVGGAMLDGIPTFKGLGMDYYQAHWYDYMDGGNWCALCTNYDEVRKRYDIDAPLVIGEIYLSPEIENPHLRLEDFYNKGYAGVWPWSIFPDSTQDKFAIDWPSVRIFAGRHQDLGPRTTNALPLVEASPTLKLSFRSDTQVANARVNPGQRQPIDVKVTATAGVSALVDIQVCPADTDDKAFQKVYDNEAFKPGETKVYSNVWQIPADAKPGPYVVKVGVFAPGRGQAYDLNDSAARFTVER
jgi:hypothetical protein